jgi:hypothetical protein
MEWLGLLVGLALDVWAKWYIAQFIKVWRFILKCIKQYRI